MISEFLCRHCFDVMISTSMTFTSSDYPPEDPLQILDQFDYLNLSDVFLFLVRLVSFFSIPPPWNKSCIIYPNIIGVGS